MLFQTFFLWSNFWLGIALTLDITLVFWNAQKGAETPEMEKGAVKAVQDLYDVVRHDVLSIDMRYVKFDGVGLCVRLIYFSFSWIYNLVNVYIRDNYETWNILSKARTEGRLFAKLKWPKDAELVCSGRFIFFLF